MKKEDFKFKYFDTTADIGIEVNTDNLNDAYIQSSLATLNLITDIEKIKPKIIKDILIESEDEYGLLYDWITEILILLNSEDFMASEYDINIKRENNSYIISGTVSGDIYNTNIYNYKTEVKAITYHKMEIEKEDNNYKIRFIVDI
ncbi:archease [Methanosphaera sp.]